jgi:hypothetical protein
MTQSPTRQNISSSQSSMNTLGDFDDATNVRKVPSHRPPAADPHDPVSSQVSTFHSSQEEDIAPNQKLEYLEMQAACSSEAEAGNTQGSWPSRLTDSESQHSFTPYTTWDPMMGEDVVGASDPRETLLDPQDEGLATQATSPSTEVQHTASEWSPIKDEAQDLPQTYWNPFWLQNLWLLAYASVFVVLLVAVFALYLYSNRVQGLAPSRNTTGMLFIWQFLPTAGEYHHFILT